MNNDGRTYPLKHQSTFNQINKWQRRLSRFIIILLISYTTLKPHLVSADTIQTQATDCQLAGVISKVLDGDSVILRAADQQTHEIRLAAIDAPEYDQAYAELAKQYLTKLIHNQTVCVRWQYIDDYQRKIGTVFLGDKDINLNLISEGLAWHYKRFQTTQSPENRQRYSQYEHDARVANIGIWSQAYPIAPWNWRMQERSNPTHSPHLSANAIADMTPTDHIGRLSCDDKQYCKQMLSCAQACFYFQSCKHHHLDSDQDNIPCENVCQSTCRDQ